MVPGESSRRSSPLPAFDPGEGALILALLPTGGQNSRSLATIRSVHLDNRVQENNV
jgi:hypothetical protein